MKMLRRILPHPVLTPALAVIWLLLTNDFSIGSIFLGLLLGWAIPFFTLRFWPDEVRIYRPLTLIRFSGLVIYDILVANFIVARLILGNPKHLKPAFIIVPLTIESDIGISLLANIISLTPGTVSSLVTENRKQLVVHALDTDDCAALVNVIQSRYEKPLREIFEAC